MANGDVVTFTRDCFESKLLDAQSATSNGAWVEVPAHFNIWSVTTTSLEEGAADATVAVRISNSATKPSDASAGEDVWASLTTSNGGNEGLGGYKYVKAAKTAGTTPIATTVIFRAVPSR